MSHDRELHDYLSAPPGPAKHSTYMPPGQCPKCMHTQHLPGPCQTPSEHGCRECGEEDNRLQQVRQLHALIALPDNDGPTEICEECRDDYPCETIRIILGDNK